MLACSRCGRVWREPPGEEGDYPCECVECVSGYEPINDDGDDEEDDDE
jgi:hypothetical protein